MTTIHNLGFPRIGAQRELKFALESCWRGDTSLHELEATAQRCASGTGPRRRGWTERRWAIFRFTTRCWT